jgi:metacaspase-1
MSVTVQNVSSASGESAEVTFNPEKQAALLIGINYLDTPSSQLGGCINDVIKVKEMLKTKLFFKEANIRLLSDNQKIAANKPTRENILKSLKQIVNKAKAEKLTKIWIHYSGHGTYSTDTPLVGDEEDGRDECICPCDFKKKGVIKDDELNKVLVQELPKSVQATVVMDCCHSGSVLDLKHKYLSVEKKHFPFMEWILSFFYSKKTEPTMNIVCLSGCKDDQTSADAYNLSGKNQWSGAMTWSLLKVLKESDYKICYSDLLSRMRNILKDSQMKQVPQLTSSLPLESDQVFLA